MAENSRALELLADAKLDPGVLRRIAELHPELHVNVAHHPSAWPELLDWLATSPDPAVKKAVAQRASAPPQPADPKPALTVAAPAFEEQPSQPAPNSGLPVVPPADQESPPARPVPPTSPTQIGAVDQARQPVAAANTSPQGRRRRIVIIGGLVVALLAAVGVVWALWLRPNTPPLAPVAPATPSGSADPATRQGDFRNGAEKLWTVNASDLVPGGVAFQYGHDNARTQLAQGPVAAGGSWLVKIREDGESDLEHLVALDAETGKVRWTKQWAPESDCVAVPGKSQFLCTYPQAGDKPGKALLVDAANGTERVLTDISRRTTYAIAAGAGMMVFEDGQLETRVHGFGLDGSVRFDKKFASPESLVDVGRPVAVYGDQVLVEYFEYTRVLDLASGDELARFTGFIQPTGYGHYIARQNAAMLASPPPKLKPAPDRGTSPMVLWANGQTVLAWAETKGLVVCDPKQPDKCQPISGLEEVWSFPERYSMRIVGGKAYIFLEDMQQGLTGVVDVAGARYLGSFSRALGWLPAKDAPDLNAPIDEVLIDAVTPDDLRMVIRHPITGSVLGSVQLQERVTSYHVQPGYLAVGSKLTQIGTPAQLSGYGAAAKPTALVGPDGTAESVSVPSVIPECPGGTLRLAWAELSKGWLIVCGYSASAPTLLRYSIDGKIGESTTVTYDGAGIYRGQLAQGALVRLSYSPAVVGIQTPDGKIMEQTQAVVVWFVALGKSKPQAGPFGVTSPDHTGADQVRYLSELLAKSKVARKSLASSVETLSACQKGTSGDYSTEIAAIDQVTANREEMLRALSAAPVDLVPDGSSLLSELTISIRHSYDADVAFASWGRGIQRNGCHKTASSAGEASSVKATAAKTVFAGHWNRVIASSYPVPKLTEGDL